MAPDDISVTDPSSVLARGWENVEILYCSSADKKTGKFPEAAEFDNLVRMYFRSNFGNGGQMYLRSIFPSCLGAQLSKLDAATVKQLNLEIKAIIRTFNGPKSFFDRHFRKFKKVTDVRYRVHRLMGILEYYKNNPPTTTDDKEKSPIKRIRFHSQFRFSKARKLFDVKLNDFKNLALEEVGAKIDGVEQLKFPEIVQVGLQKIGRLVWDNLERDPTHVLQGFELLKLGLSNAKKVDAQNEMTKMTQISLAIIEQTMAKFLPLTDEEGIIRLRFIWKPKKQWNNKSYGEFLDAFVAQQFEKNFETICSKEVLSEWKKQVESGFDQLKHEFTNVWGNPTGLMQKFLDAHTKSINLSKCKKFVKQTEVLNGTR